MTIEERLSLLEADVATLKKNGPLEQKRNWLEKVLGSMKDESDFAEVLRLGQEIRRADRPSS